MVEDSYSHYIERVLEEEDRILLREAINSARAGALRAAYIMVWLSAAESIKRKFKTLAVRDAQAGQIVGEINRKETQQQAIDKFLLEKSKEYGFLSDSEFCRLEHIYDMRCIYGHPYEEGPNEESLVAALAEAVDIVLSKPTKLRHRFINDQIELLTSNPTFLDDLQEAVSKYAQEVYPKIDDNLHRYFITKLWERLEPIAQDASLRLIFRRGIWFSRSYLAAEPEAILRSWDLVSILPQLPAISSLALASTGLWTNISDHAKDIIIGELLTRGRSAGIYLKTAEVLAERSALSDRHHERFLEALFSLEPSFLLSVGIPFKYYAPRIINSLKNHHWPTQNPAIDVIENVGFHQLSLLPEAMQIELGENVLQSAEGSARRSEQLLQKIGTRHEPWPPRFIFGIVRECFINDRNEVRFKIRQLMPAARCLSCLNPNVASAMIEEVSANIRKGTLKYGWEPESKRQEVLKSLELVESELGFSLEDLKSTVGGIEFSEEEIEID